MWVMKCGLCPIMSLLIEFQPLPRSLQDSDIQNHGRISPENGTRFIPDIIMYGPCNILTWLSHGTHKILT